MLRKRSDRQKRREGSVLPLLGSRGTEAPPPAPPVREAGAVRPSPSSLRSPRRRRWLRVLIGLAVAYMLVFCLTMGAGLAYVLSVLESVDPQLARLETYRPKQVTRVLDHDGALVGELFEEKRDLVSYSEIPLDLIQALIATEDKNFFHHYGVDPLAILRAAIVNLKAGAVRQGGSTLTQQLAKDMFTTGRQTFERKIKEAFLALRITQRYTKEETLELYLNQVEFGHNTHGIQSAAQFYFDKNVSDMNLEECATLVGLLKAPTAYSPKRNPKRSAERMRLVLARMVEEGYLSEREMQRAGNRTLRLAGDRPTVPRVVNSPYFMDYVSKDLAGPSMFGTRESPGALSQTTGLSYDDIREQGYLVRTGLDSRLHEVCQEALRTGVARIEQERRRRSWYWGDANPPAWPTRLSDGAVLDAVIEASAADSLTVRLSLNNSRVQVPFDPDEPSRRWMTEYGVLDKGYHVRVVAHGLPETDPGTGLKHRFTLMDEPHVQGAVVVLEANTGRILAMVGGTNYFESNFNRASQARRQPGSAFKPIEYAAALEQREKWLKQALAAESQGLPLPPLYGFTPMSRLYDKYLEFRIGPRRWVPRNYHNEYWGPVTVRFAMEKSLNVATIDLVMRFAENWPRGVRLIGEMARRLGIDSPVGDNLSIALGTSELSPLELAAAYATFANGGVLHRPWAVKSITRLDGVQVYTHAPAPSAALSPEVAFLVTRLLQNVVENGTGVRAGRELGRNLAGKTGTTNEYTDAWFAGYSSGIVAVVYVGFDVKKSLGSRMEGAQAALPIWIEVMRRTRELYPGHFREFEAPPGVVMVGVCGKSGRLPVGECIDARTFTEEYFLAGTEPYEYCDLHAPAPLAPAERPSLLALTGGERRRAEMPAAPVRRERGLPPGQAPSALHPRDFRWWDLPLVRFSVGSELPGFD